MFGDIYTGGYVHNGHSALNRPVSAERINIVPEKGGIYLMKTEVDGIERCKPVIVVSDTDYNKGPFCFVCPLTIDHKDPKPTIFKTWATGQVSNAILDNLRSIDKTKLVEYVGHLSNVELQSCADSICSLFGINTLSLPETSDASDNGEQVAIKNELAKARRHEEELQTELEFYKSQFNILLDKLLSRG